MKSEQEWEIELRDILKKLRNNSSDGVHLGDRKLDANGAKVLASALKGNHSLTILNLYGNSIGNVGAAVLAKVLKKNRSLTTVDLGRNEIGDEGAEALAKSLKENRSLTTIFLNENRIGDEGAEALAEAIKVNHSLTTMDLYNSIISAKGADALVEALKVNRSLTTMSLSLEWGSIYAETFKKYLDRNAVLRYELHQAVLAGDLKKTQKYIQRGAGLLSVTEEENTPLHWAAAKGHIDIVKFLLAKMIEEKFNLAVENKYRRTPLDLAEKNGREKIVQLLQEAKEKVVQDNGKVASQPSTAEKDIYVYLQQGDRFFVEEDYGESLQSYESVLELQPENVGALIRKGKVLQKLNQLEEAKQVYKQAIAIEDKSAEKYHQQAKSRLDKIEKKQESTGREELLLEQAKSKELRMLTIQQNSAMKVTKSIDPSAAIPLSRRPARVQFGLPITLQANSSKQNENNSKKEPLGIAEEKTSSKVLQ